MGSQQILLIVVGVIIVGIAIAVGFMMFGSGAYAANRSAIAAELQGYGTPLLQYWKLPASMGGASTDTGKVTDVTVAATLGFTLTGEVYSKTSESGEFRVMSAAGGLVVIAALGSEVKGGKHPYAVMTIDLLTSEIETDVSETTGFE
jgi:hypothetical protein